MASTSSTIPALKSSFLNAQARILSQPLEPEKIRRHSGDTIPDSVIQDVTREVNRELRRHSKSAYSSLAIRAVAEQIDNLYWRSAEPDAHDDELDEGPDGIRVLGTDDDLSWQSNISRLPALFEDLAPAEAPSVDLDALSEQLAHLQELDSRRAALNRKLASYNALLKLLAPFEHAQKNIQPNLVTKDGPLATELTKLRMMSLRVNGRLGDWVEARKAEDAVRNVVSDETWPSEEERLAAVLAS
ncbi:hypothetical protein EJ05DRAFT_510352 [Pseudovirgaria hyperparasitica]|uniref:Kinetochore protein fta4 n=1 Tax=Pseudovirgaria hyperparasitica TaxID=470096 RepID=A0A6A6W714_9PEZI|nr:uncharacterized protein EJ05DRAFT_510352 [Pseudovirgaria hyperparasitica]KAF2758423.1 hypothetical protein EJ05DRAFT_510352 [Pseudovirgaria hyperparasitica]